VTHRTAATRYARALIEVAQKEHVDLSQIEHELDAFIALLTSNPAFEQVLLNPAVPAAKKRDAVAALAGRMNVVPVVAKLLALLAERDRLILIRDLLSAYRDRVQTLQNVVRAEVTTAAELAPERAREIERNLAQLTGRTVLLSTRVDPAIVGGMVTKIGSTVYDGSVTNQLRRMRQRLLSEVRG
jgi:F-type H+-transporting ATPase subunit delta